MVIALITGKFSGQLGGLFIFAVLFGFSWGGQAVLRFTFSADMFGLVAIGVITSVLALLEATGAAMGSFIAGYIFDIIGSYDVMFTLGIGVSLFGALLSYLIKPMRQEVMRQELSKSI